MMRTLEPKPSRIVAAARRLFRGLGRILSSSKGIMALTGMVALVLVRRYGLEPGQAGELSQWIVTLAGLYIVGTAYEDGKAKGG